MIVHGATVPNAGRWATDAFNCNSRRAFELNWVCDDLAHACRPTKAPGPSAGSGRAGNATPIDSQLKAHPIEPRACRC
jgi:hypothetical protein